MLIRIHQMPSDHRHILIIIPMCYNNTMNDAIPPSPVRANDEKSIQTQRGGSDHGSHVSYKAEPIHLCKILRVRRLSTLLLPIFMQTLLKHS